MERKIFVEHFHAAAAAALSFAQQFVLENLSDKLTFRVQLNQSYDMNLRSDQKVYPEDSVPQRGNELHRCGEDEVIQAIWRDGTVPEWVDIAVVGQTATESILELRCCGRFTGDESRLYHQRAGIPPFSVHGPTLPPEHSSGDRFSIWHRLAAWDRSEIETAGPHIAKVWSLALVGNQFDDSTLASLPVFPNVEIIELKDSPLTGDGMCSVFRHPKLRVLRIDLSHPELFDLRGAILSSRLKLLDIHNLPPRPCGLEKLLDGLTGLTSLTLASDGKISFSGSILGASDFLTITAENIEGELRLPSSVGHLALHLSKATASDLSRLLQSVENVRALSLIRTPVDDRLADEIVRRLRPEYVNLVHTKVSTDGLRHLMETYPDIRIHPKSNSEKIADI